MKLRIDRLFNRSRSPLMPESSYIATIERLDDTGLHISHPYRELKKKKIVPELIPTEQVPQSILDAQPEQGQEIYIHVVNFQISSMSLLSRD